MEQTVENLFKPQNEKDSTTTTKRNSKYPTDNSKDSYSSYMEKPSSPINKFFGIERYGISIHCKNNEFIPK